MLCKKCNCEKEENAFYSRRKVIGLRYDSTCKICRNAEAKINHDPVVRYKKELPKKFGISWEDYLEIYEKQEGLCAICGLSIKINGEHTHRLETGFVDHNHTTGRVRGLLCSQCNMALGLFKDSKEVILKAAKYLDEIDFGTD